VHNLAADPAHRETLQRMREALEKRVVADKDNGFLPEGSKLEGYDASHAAGAFPIERVFALANLASDRDAANLPKLIRAMDDPSEPIRWWAVQGCTMLREKAAPAEPALRKRLDDESGAVQVAAAEAMARLGRLDAAMPVLERWLQQNETPPFALQAANVLARLGESGRPALPAMKKVLAALGKGQGKGESYPVRILARVVDELEGRREPLVYPKVAGTGHRPGTDAQRWSALVGVPSAKVAGTLRVPSAIPSAGATGILPVPNVGQVANLPESRQIGNPPHATGETPVSPTNSSPARPNIVYLLADQLRASATGYAGDPNVKTPNLDRLAAEGLNFRNVVSVCPVCTPYRAALMTGRYPTSTGMFLNDAHLPDGELCIAQVLRSAGYATGYIGKWHLDGHGRAAYIPPERRRGWEYWKAAECDHFYNQSHYYAGNSPVKQFWQGYDAYAETDDARQYIRDHARGPQPFVLFVSYGIPHFPHGIAPADLKSLYPPASIKLPPNVPAAMEAKARQEAQGYYAHCTALDRCVGDVLRTLDESGIARNTIVVVTADHGEMLGSHGCPPTMKQVPWDESAHVPLLLRWPALPGSRGRVVSMPLTTPDIFATLLGLAGVKVPETAEGEDLSPRIREGHDGDDRDALYMGVSPFIPNKFTGEYRAIRTIRYTYVRRLDGPWLLFDDRSDPYQMDNLAAKPEHAGLVKELDARLAAQLKRIGDDFASAREYLDRFGYDVAPGASLPTNAENDHPTTPRRKARP